MVGWVGLAPLAGGRPPLVGLRRSTLRWPWMEILVAAMDRLALPDERAAWGGAWGGGVTNTAAAAGLAGGAGLLAALQAVPAVALMRQTSREREATEEAVAP